MVLGQLICTLGKVVFTVKLAPIQQINQLYFSFVISQGMTGYVETKH